MILEGKGLEKSFRFDDSTIEVLKGADISMQSGGLTGIVGASGTGKSTLLHILGGLDKPTAGKVSLNGADIFAMDDDGRAKFRGENIGFIFQFHHLLPEFSAMENVSIPAMIFGKDAGIACKRAEELLSSVGLAGRMHHRPGKLSGGERQRVAIVRALMNNPKVLLADEPTGNLDENTADEVFELIQKMVKEKNLASLVVTHNMKLARKMDVVYELHEGRLNLYDGRTGIGKTNSGA